MKAMMRKLRGEHSCKEQEVGNKVSSLEWPEPMVPKPLFQTSIKGASMSTTSASTNGNSPGMVSKELKRRSKSMSKWFRFLVCKPLTKNWLKPFVTILMTSSRILIMVCLVRSSQRSWALKSTTCNRETTTICLSYPSLWSKYCVTELMKPLS